ARQLNAELRLLVVCDYNHYMKGVRALDPSSIQRARREYSTRKRAWLQEVASSLDGSSVAVALDVAWDRPLHEGIGRQVLRYEPDLVIKDTHHHPALG